MTLGLAYWILMLVWLAFGLWSNGWKPTGGNVLLFLVLALLGWPPGLRLMLGWQILTQFYARYPLAGCGITQADGTARVIVVGRN